MINYIIKKLTQLQKWYRSLGCPNCGKWFSMDQGHWTRGWNNLCEQAYGDSGHRCFDCGHIEWEKPLEKHRATLPNWCTPSVRLSKHITNILSEEQIKKAIAYFKEHEAHVFKLLNSTDTAYEPSQIEDKNDPRIWKAEYWKWFLSES